MKPKKQNRQHDDKLRIIHRMAFGNKTKMKLASYKPANGPKLLSVS